MAISKSYVRTKIGFLLLLFLGVVDLCWPSTFQNGTSFADQIRNYQSQLETNPNQVEIRLALARTYLLFEAFEQATAEYQRIIEIDPKRADGYFGLGLSLAGQEEFDKSISAYKSALDISPHLPQYHAALGRSYAQLYRYDQAESAYQTAIDIKTDDAMFHHQLGVVYANQGKRDEAISQQKRAITIQPQLSQAHHQLGMLYGQQNLWDKAISAYLIALKQNPELVESSYNLAQAYFRHGKMEEAQQQMNRYQKLKSQIDPINKLRGAFQQSHDQLERAAIKSNIGRIYLKHKKFKEAITEYQKAIGLNPKQVEAHNGIGLAYTMTQKYDLAISAQKRAFWLKLMPDWD